jgi:hypothetical protein
MMGQTTIPQSPNRTPFYRTIFDVHDPALRQIVRDPEPPASKV